MAGKRVKSILFAYSKLVNNNSIVLHIYLRTQGNDFDMYNNKEERYLHKS